MTLSGNNRRTRGEQLKQDRIDRQGAVAKRFPWLMPAIITLAVILVVAGIVIAAILGKLF
jgi:lipopolysaccharide/colanic/teichoic acid biosynthesis glycosyltransferase